ncbi:hypothetical protein CsSME_00041715 [Camellia sinensis var. sinensis]
MLKGLCTFLYMSGPKGYSVYFWAERLFGISRPVGRSVMTRPKAVVENKTASD